MAMDVDGLQALGREPLAGQSDALGNGGDGQVGVDSTHMFDPDAPEFLPGATIGAARGAAGGVEPVKAQSLIFGGGGNFLSKYSSVQRGAVGGDGLSRRRRSDGAGISVAGDGVGGATPNRTNVQLNTWLVHAKTTDKIFQVVDMHFNHFNAVNLITALHRLATVVTGDRKASVRRDGRFRQLIGRLTGHLESSCRGSLKPQDLSNIAWALTKLGLLNAALFSLLSEHILLTIDAFEPVNLSMTLWAFARSGFLDEKLFRVAAVEVHKQLPEFQPQQIANTAWAMAKSGFVDEDLFDAVARLTLEKLEDFHPMNFSMLAYSFALAKVSHPELFDAIAKRCIATTLAKASTAPHVVTNLALAYSEVGVGQHPEVFDTVAHVAGNSLFNFRTQQISTLATAFARAEVKHEELFRRISSAVVRRLAEFRQTDLQDLLAAYDRLGLSTTGIAKAVQAQQWQEEPRSQTTTWMSLAAGFALLLALAVAWQNQIAGGGRGLPWAPAPSDAGAGLGADGAGGAGAALGTGS